MYLGVTNDDNAKSCPSQGNIQTSRVVKKADALVFIGPHARQHDEIFLTSLERVDTRHLNLLQCTECLARLKRLISIDIL